MLRMFSSVQRHKAMGVRGLHSEPVNGSAIAKCKRNEMKHLAAGIALQAKFGRPFSSLCCCCWGPSLSPPSRCEHVAFHPHFNIFIPAFMLINILVPIRTAPFPIIFRIFLFFSLLCLHYKFPFFLLSSTRRVLSGGYLRSFCARHINFQTHLNGI